jgi:hypothetical protein
MWWTRFFAASVVLGLLLAGAPAAWASGTAFTALTEPIGNWVVTIQWILGVVGTLAFIISCIIAIRSEAAGIIGIVFSLILIILALKGPDIIGTFGPPRAIAATVTLPVISAGQQVLDAAVTWLVHGVWSLVALWQVRHGRRAAGL